VKPIAKKAPAPTPAPVPASPGQQLFEAAAAGRLGECKTLVNDHRGRREVLNWQAPDGRTPCFAAAKAGQLDVLRLLASCPGVQINLSDARGRSPLSCAVKILGSPEAVRCVCASMRRAAMSTSPRLRRTAPTRHCG
jgi:hypothetical protein